MPNVNLVNNFAFLLAKRIKKLMFYASQYLLFLAVFFCLWLQVST